MSDDNKLLDETESNVSSGFFSYRKNHSIPSVTPILIDNLSLRARIVTGLPEIGLFPTDSIPTKRFPGPEHLASAFANPLIYPTQRGRPYLKLFGQHSLRTNGRRIYRHVIGDPLSHKAGQDSTILAEDKQHNQITDSELPHLLELARSANQDADTWQLTRMLSSVFSSHTEIMKTYELEALNPPQNYKKHLSIERLEVYFEVLGLFDYYEITQALKKVLYRYFRGSDKRRHRLERSSDREDQDAYMAWVVSPDLVSSDFRSGQEFKIKVYKKFDRVRVEIQANFPKLKEPTEWNDNTSPFMDFASNVIRTEIVLAQKLRLIQNEVFGSLQETVESVDLTPMIAGRLKELRPTKSKHLSFDKVVHHIATHEAITLKDLEAIGWSRNDINIMADKHFGFLALKPAGIDVKPNGKKRIIKGVYVLVRDWLNRTGKPDQKRVRSRAWSLESYPDLARFNNLRVMDQLEGSALIEPDHRSAIKSA